MFSIVLFFLLFATIVLSTSLRGIIQYEIDRMTTERIDLIILGIAKSNTEPYWMNVICEKDLFYFQISDKEISILQNIFTNRSIRLIDDCRELECSKDIKGTNCKKILVEWRRDYF